MKYQDELEAQHCDDVSAQVEKYRASLLKRMEEKLDSLDNASSGKTREKQKKRQVCSKLRKFARDSVVSYNVFLFFRQR